MSSPNQWEYFFGSVGTKDPKKYKERTRHIEKARKKAWEEEEKARKKAWEEEQRAWAAWRGLVLSCVFLRELPGSREGLGPRGSRVLGRAG